MSETRTSCGAFREKADYLTMYLEGGEEACFFFIILITYRITHKLIRLFTGYRFQIRKDSANAEGLEYYFLSWTVKQICILVNQIEYIYNQL